ncbi:MAG: hypothetical protein FWD66_01340 [Paludibacter sp.]|nr:hypothetical protein [Paludibacter sp.]
MKAYLLILSLFIAVNAIAAPPHITRELNLPRSGDVIVKQQVEYKDPGRAGADVVWDFGQLQPINPEYTLEYEEPIYVEDSLSGGFYLMGKDTVFASLLQPSDAVFIGREHRTLYYYVFTDSVLVTLGYQNAATDLHYRKPLLTGKLPMTFSDSLSHQYITEGFYTRSVPFAESGSVSLAGDAYGMIILPTGDTLRQVLRTKAVQQKAEPLLTTEGDSATVNTYFERYKWYARGYRYPVFETLRTVIYIDTTETNRYETAFLYPPPQQYSQVPDTANANELALMLAEENEHSQSSGGDQDDIWAGMYYNIFPNPVITNLQFELYLPHFCNDVHVQIRDKMGLTFIDRNMGAYPEGISSFTFNLSGLMPDNYVLDFWLDGYLVHGSVVMKR